MADVPFERHDIVKVGVVGIGRRQVHLLRQLMRIEGVRVTGLCDQDPTRLEMGKDVLAESQSNQAQVRTFAHLDDLLARDDVDVVCIATPWDLHAPMAVSAMTAGKHVLLEVPAATTLEGCWSLVEASERTRRHCVLLENCCYGREELMVLNLTRSGLLGDLIHGEAAYIHDLRRTMFGPEGGWRRQAHITRNGNLYPTHALGPIALYMGIQRGDRMESIVSMSSRSQGLATWRKEHVPAGTLSSETYHCGDVNTSLITTTLGRTLMVQYSVVTPRPYDRLNVIWGTRGIFRGFPPRVFVEGVEPADAYESVDHYWGRFEHPLWARYRHKATESGGHAGADFIMLQRLINVMRAGRPPDLDVYDAAAWSVVGPLSEESVARGAMPLAVPDFMGGNGLNRVNRLTLE